MNTQPTLLWNLGDVILDLYQVLDDVGEGSFGKVYKVRHQGWNEDLAVKIPRPEIVAAAGGKENFEQEAEDWVKLGLHPHTVSCYYVRRIDDYPAMFAEYVVGGSLKDWIYGVDGQTPKLYQEGKDVALLQILDIGIQLAWALHFSHEKRLVHQDVKPGNVMMTPQGTAKLTDFGLVKAAAVADVDVKTKADGTVLADCVGGSEPYFSPEQAEAFAQAQAGVEKKARVKLDYRSDLWSWAVVMLEMFQGECTWLSGSIANFCLEAYLKDGPRNLGSPPMPEAVVEVLRHCFQENSHQRPEDMLAVAQQLQGLFEELAGSGYPREFSEIDRYVADSLNNQAVSLYDLGKEKEALERWQQALEAQPLHPESTYNQGLILWRKAEINDDVLVRDLEQVQQAQAGNLQVSNLLAQVHLERDDCETAIRNLEASYKTSFRNKEVEQILEFARRKLPNSNRLLKTIRADKDMRDGFVIKGEISLSGDDCLVLSGIGYGGYRDEKYYEKPVGSKYLGVWSINTGNCEKKLALPYREKEKQEVLIESPIDNSISVDWIAPILPVAKGQLNFDGSFLLAYNSNFKALGLYDINTGQCLKVFQDAKSGILSPNRQFLVSISDASTNLWDVNKGTCLKTFQKCGSALLSFTGDFILSIGEEGSLEIWDAKKGVLLSTIQGSSPTSISQNGQLIIATDSFKVKHQSGKLVGSGSEHAFKLWDCTTGKCLKTFQGHTEIVNSLLLSRDGNLAVSSSLDRTLKLWNTKTGVCLRTFQGHEFSIHSVCLSNSEDFIASSSNDNTIKIWQINVSFSYSAPLAISKISKIEQILSGQLIYEKKLIEANSAMSKQDYEMALKYIQEARAQTGCFYGIEAIKTWSKLYYALPRKSLQGLLARQTFWSDNIFVHRVSQLTKPLSFYVGNKNIAELSLANITIWNIDVGNCIKNFSPNSFSGEITLSGCFSKEGALAIIGNNNGDIKILSTTTGKCLRTICSPGQPVYQVCISYDGKFILSAHRNDTLKLWDFSTGICVRTFLKRNQSRICSISICLTRDNRFVISSEPGGNNMFLWDVLFGKITRTFKGHTDFINSIFLSHSEKYILSGGNDKNIKLWELETGKCIQTFYGHTDFIKTVSLTPDDQFALSCGNDKTLKIWNVKTGKCIKTFDGFQEVSLSNDGRSILVRNIDGKLKLFSIDWELEGKQLLDWEQEAQCYLDNFLWQHTPYAGTLLRDREPTEQEITLALTRQGKPIWTEQDFQDLIYTLGCAGHGYLRPESVRKKLEEMAAEWNPASPSLGLDSFEESEDTPKSHITPEPKPTNKLYAGNPKTSKPKISSLPKTVMPSSQPKAENPGIKQVEQLQSSKLKTGINLKPIPRLNDFTQSSKGRDRVLFSKVNSVHSAPHYFTNPPKQLPKKHKRSLVRLALPSYLFLMRTFFIFCVFLLILSGSPLKLGIIYSFLISLILSWLFTLLIGKKIN